MEIAVSLGIIFILPVSIFILLAIVAAPFIAPFITAALAVGLVAVAFMGFSLLLWVVSENVALSVLIVSVIVVVNLIVHNERVKAFCNKRFS